MSSPEDSLAITISRDGNYRLTVRGPCRAQSGPFHLEDGTLTVTTLSSTLEACEPPAGAVDDWIGDLLGEPVSVTVLGSETTWENSFGSVVLFRSDGGVIDPISPSPQAR